MCPAACCAEALPSGAASGALVQLSMAEFSERNSVARLTGAPPGYVGYGKGGVLSDALRRSARAGRGGALARSAGVGGWQGPLEGSAPRGPGAGLTNLV